MSSTTIVSSAPNQQLPFQYPLSSTQQPVGRCFLLQLGVEYHKRFDPIYSDARNRARNLGPFSYFYSYMAQVRGGSDRTPGRGGLAAARTTYACGSGGGWVIRQWC